MTSSENEGLHTDPGSGTDTRGRWLDIAYALLFAAMMVLALRYQLRLLDYITWEDEAETVVAAKMMAAGQRLYSEIFNHHGPLTFLSGLIVEKLGGRDIAAHRIPIALLQLCALAAIYFSPLARDRFTRMLYTAAAAAFVILFMPDSFGHTYSYQAITGLLLMIVLAQFTLPALLKPESVNPKRAFGGYFLLAALPFLGITYLPVAVLLALASIRREYLGSCVLGAAAGVVANLVFLAATGSFSGYLAFHIYLNSRILPTYIHGDGPTWPHLIGNAYQTVTRDLAQYVLFAIVMASIAMLAAREKGVPWRALLVCAGMGSLLIRGPGFQEVPYFYSLVALGFVPLADRPPLPPQFKVLALGFTAVFVFKMALVVPDDQAKLAGQKIDYKTDFARLAQAFTREGDRVIAYSFENLAYIAAGRLPASGHYFYLPWQQKYAEAPRFGISIDACRDLSENRPKIVLLDKWLVWDKYPWESYGSCIQRIVDTNYLRVGNSMNYVRRDLLAERTGHEEDGSRRRMQPGPELAAGSPIRIAMSAAHTMAMPRKPLARIGILVSTRKQRNSGEAELVLRGADGAETRQRFQLQDLADDEYRYFDVPPGDYLSGQIVPITGGGIRLWESIDFGGAALTCVSFEYADGKHRFTPGCRLF